MACFAVGGAKLSPGMLRSGVLSHFRSRHSSRQWARSGETLNVGFGPSRPGARFQSTYHLVLLAEALAAGGRYGEGLAALREATSLVEETGERYVQAEIRRLEGNLPLAENSSAEAEACYVKALQVARAQEARLLELRAARDLARLWAGQGRRAEARDLLAPVYGWFTEGFDTADLKEAKALLDELDGSSAPTAFREPMATERGPR